MPDINSKYKDLQESSKESAPPIQVLSNTKPNPKNTLISKILNKFRSLISSTWSNKFEVKKIEDSLVVEDIDKIVDESFQSKKSNVKLDKIQIGDDYEGLLPHYDKNIINYLYSLSFNSENVPERPNKAYSKLVFNLNLLAEAREFLKSTSYNGLDVIVNDIINPEVLQNLADKFNLGIEFSKLERIIADVFVLSGDGSKYLGPSINNENSYGKVNSESLSNENSFEKTEENLEKVGVMQQKGKSMPELEPGGKVGYIKHEPGKEYEVGEIIIYNKKGVNIFHEVVGYKDTSSGRVYTTKGINNKNPDRKGVYEHQILGQVVKFSKQDLAYLIEMAEQGRLSYIEGFGMTKFNEIIQKIVSVFKGLKSKLSQALFGRNDELDSLITNTELNYEDVSNFIDKIAELKPDDVGKPLNFLRNLKRQSINKYYEILNEYASKELKVIIKPEVTNVYKALDLIMNAHILFNFKEYDEYKGIVIENVKVDPNNIAYTQFKAKSYPSGRIIINENFYLNRDLMDMVLNNFIPHELGHLKIRTMFDEICGGCDIECYNDGLVKNKIAIEIEEFIVDANRLSYLDGERKMKYAEQYCKWLDILLSEKWSSFTDENGNQKLAEDLSSREMLVIMHHKVILEYIQKNVLRNKREVNAIKHRIDDYYKQIIKHLSGLNFDLNIEKHIKKYILDKFSSCFGEIRRNEEGFLNDYLKVFPKNPDKDHTSETWIEYISNILLPSFENEYLH